MADQKVEFITVTIPVVTDEFDQQTGPRIITKFQARFLTLAQSHAVHRTLRGLREMGERFGSDKKASKEVASHADTIRWLLEQIEQQVEAKRADSLGEVVLDTGGNGKHGKVSKSKAESPWVNHDGPIDDDF